MSFSSLRDIFLGRLDANFCTKTLLSLKSPNNAKEYLRRVHKVIFPQEDKRKKERWNRYPRVEGAPKIAPILEKDLSNSLFINRQTNKLSFDISRFTEFLDGYARVNDDIKPVMLHYAMIYLFDFFTRTWLKYGQNWGHGISLVSHPTDFAVKIKKSGIFPRAVDAFYFVDQPSLLSIDDNDGIEYFFHAPGTGTISKKIKKIKYSKTPTVKLTHLIDVYNRLGALSGRVSKSNCILVGFVLLFVISSISRYKAEAWFKIRANRNLKNRFDLLQHDFLYEWIPEILLQTVLKRQFEPPGR